MADAKKKKAHWRERLQHLAVESCWILRESLLAKGAATMMVLEDNKTNALESKKLVRCGFSFFSLSHLPLSVVLSFHCLNLSILHFSLFATFPSLPPSIPSSLPPSIPSSLPPFLPLSLHPSLPPSIPFSLLPLHSTHLHPHTHQIASLEKDKMAAAQRGFIPRVNDIMRSIEQYTTAKSVCEEKIALSSEVIAQIRDELGSLDKKLHTLRPGLKLDTLENRCMGMRLAN